MAKVARAMAVGMVLAVMGATLLASIGATQAHAASFGQKYDYAKEAYGKIDNDTYADAYYAETRHGWKKAILKAAQDSCHGILFEDFSCGIRAEDGSIVPASFYDHRSVN